ncbi:zinc finger protein 883-like [Phlebotomus argentipes]|uniref:zinc finger protein 883-like n=1 Tax=Phlebotomus argentipes TaxID=94469 RepID=UPI0028930136|nr:zinc finger protein 883-like [Phlebotomus argentipes]
MQDSQSLNFEISVKEEIISKSDEVCRFCVGKTPDYSSIFQDDLHESLKSCFGLMIQETDNWPKFICRQCLNSAKTCIDFVSRIRESEKNLRDLYGEWTTWKDIERIEIKPDIEMVDVKELPLLCADVKAEVDQLEESTTTRKKPQKKTVLEETLPRKRGRPRKHPVQYEDIPVSCGDDKKMLGKLAGRRGRPKISSCSEDEKPSSPPLEAAHDTMKEEQEAKEEDKNLSESQSYKELSDEKSRKIEEFFKMDCNQCPEKFSRFKDLQAHYRSVHKRKGYILCCKVKLSRTARILQHIEFHMNPNVFKCDECGKTFKNKLGLQQHKVNSHTPKELHLYKCPKCPRTFMHQQRFRTHSAVHAEQRNHICPECGKAFPTKGRLKAHVMNMHQEVSYHVCEICAKMFKSKDCFLDHQRTHTGEKIEKVPCPTCGKFFSEKRLKVHMKRHNESDEVFRCHLCDRESNSQTSLNRHIKYVHMSERKYKCNLCESSFKRPVDLREHMATHTSNQILYTCLFCPKQFNSNANKYNHQKVKHPEEYQAMKEKRFAEANAAP